jgi:hypothetical protein
MLLLFALGQPQNMILLLMPPVQLGAQACTTMSGLLIAVGGFTNFLPGLA